MDVYAVNYTNGLFCNDFISLAYNLSNAQRVKADIGRHLVEFADAQVVWGSVETLF